MITNKELLAEIAGVVMAEFAKMEVTEDTYVSLKHSIVGYPADGKLQREPLPRKGNPVTWVE